MFGSEKNCYIEMDIGKIWGEYEALVGKAHFDRNRRAVVNVRWLVGWGGVISMTTMSHLVLLKRDSSDETIVRELGAHEALDYLLANGFCNPHLLVKDERKLELRRRFFGDYLKQVSIHLVNSTRAPEETQAVIRQILAVSGN